MARLGSIFACTTFFYVQKHYQEEYYLTNFSTDSASSSNAPFTSSFEGHQYQPSSLN